MAKFEELMFRRIWDFNLLPHRLFESIAAKDKVGMWNLENLYNIGPVMARSPLHHIYVMLDKEYVIHGVLWVVIEPISVTVWIQAASVDKEYKSENAGVSDNVMTHCVKFLKETYKDTKIRTFATKDKVLERLGWKKLGYQAMEI